MYDATIAALEDPNIFVMRFGLDIILLLCLSTVFL